MTRPAADKLVVPTDDVHVVLIYHPETDTVDIDGAGLLPVAIRGIVAMAQQEIEIVYEALHEQSIIIIEEEGEE